MSCPQLYFNHSPPSGLSTDISINTRKISVGQFSNITVTLRNQSASSGEGQVQIFWAPVVSKLPAAPFTAIVPPAGVPNPTAAQSIPGSGSYSFVVPWSPDSSVQPSSSDPTHLALFATSIATAVPGVCAGVSYPGDYDWTHTWNAAQIFIFG